MCQTMNENAHGQKGNNPGHKVRILKMFRVKNGIYKSLRVIWNKLILAAGILDSRNPLNSALEQIRENWLCEFL